MINDYVVRGVARVDGLCDLDLEYEFSTLEEAKSNYKAMKKGLIKAPKQMLGTISDADEKRNAIKNFFRIEW
jgi:hypothetical protein